jgi:hypothetical protein
VIDQSMQHLRERLDRDIGPTAVRHGVPLIINVLVSEGERRLFGGLRNLKKDGSIQRSFGYVMQELSGPFVFANGSGAALVAAGGHLDQLRSQMLIRPRKVEDHMNLLAKINRRVAAHESTVSPFCQVSYLNADEHTGPMSQTYLQRGEAVPFEMPVLLFGLDLTDMTRHFHQWSSKKFKGQDAGPDWDQDAANKSVQRRR